MLLMISPISLLMIDHKLTVYNWRAILNINEWMTIIVGDWLNSKHGTACTTSSTLQGEEEGKSSTSHFRMKMAEGYSVRIWVLELNCPSPFMTGCGSSAKI